MEGNHNKRHSGNSLSFRGTNYLESLLKIYKRCYGYSTPFLYRILNQVQYMFRDDACYENL